MLIMDPGKNLKAMREALHWSQVDLGKLAGISKGQISHMETGGRRAGPKNRPRLAKAFNMTENAFTRALHADKDDAVMLVLLNQLPPELKAKMVNHLAELFSTIKDKPEFLSGFISQIVNYTDLAKKV